MKLGLILGFIIASTCAMAFDMKGFIQKASKDEKMQQQAKDVAKKGYDYFKSDKKDEKKEKENAKL